MLRDQQRGDREERRARLAEERERKATQEPDGLVAFLAGRAQSIAAAMDRWLASLIDRGSLASEREGLHRHAPEPAAQQNNAPAQDHGADHDH